MTRGSCNRGEFVIPLSFEVLSARYETIILKDPNVTFGKERAVTGTVDRVVLGVKQEGNFQVPDADSIKQLVFEGYCHIEAGDKIRTYIEKYHETEQTGYYTERDFLPTESVSRIEKRSKRSDKELLAEFLGLPKSRRYN